MQARTLVAAGALGTATSAQVHEAMAEPSVTAFLNVDLDLRGVARIDELLDGLGDDVVILNRGRNAVSVELATQPQSAEEAIMKWSTLVERLPPTLRETWHHCEARVFNVGIQAGSEPHEFYCGLSREAIRRLATLDGEVAVTVYAAPPMGR